MPFQFNCTSCGQPIGAMEQQVGMATSCPNCGAQQVVPMAPAGGVPSAGFQPQQGQPYGYGSQGGPAGYGQPQPQQVYVESGGGGSPFMKRLAGIGGFILFLIVVNIILYVFDCGWIVY